MCSHIHSRIQSKVERENLSSTVSCPRTVRENSSRQQARQFRTRHRKRQLYTVHERESIRDHAQKRMSTENNTGVKTRAMAQRVDKEANPEQLQRAADPAMNPTVELHRTKEEAIEEFA